MAASLKDPISAANGTEKWVSGIADSIFVFLSAGDERGGGLRICGCEDCDSPPLSSPVYSAELMTGAPITVWTPSWREQGSRECVESLKWNSHQFTPLSGNRAKSHYALQNVILYNFNFFLMQSHFLIRFFLSNKLLCLNVSVIIQPTAEKVHTAGEKERHLS